jgi:hypothetical protein
MALSSEMVRRQFRRPAAGADNTILQGNTGSAPTFKSTINGVAIGGTTPAAGAFTTTALGTATGTSVAVTGAITSSSASAGIGYTTGAGNTVTQGTSKSTTVVINALCGTISMFADALAAAATVTFTVTNSACAATDVIATQHDSGGTIGSYTITANTPAGGSFKITVRNNTAGNLSEAVVIRFAIIKAVTS